MDVQLLLSRVFASTPCLTSTQTTSGSPLYEGHCNEVHSLGPGARICSALKEELDHFQMPVPRRSMQWGPAAVVVSIYVYAVLDEDTNDFEVALLRRAM